MTDQRQTSSPTKITAPARPPIVKVMMMQKDEGPRLARWLTHYACLFGMENLLIFDNGSEEVTTLALLDEAERCGAHVRRDLDTAFDFQNKGGHFTNVIRSLNQDAEYDFALPVDCDELLCVFTETGLSLGKADILAEFARLKPWGCPFRIELSLFNLPGDGHEGWYAPNRHFHKGFVPAYHDATIDNGHHAPALANTTDVKMTRFVYLHSHNRPYQEMIDLSRAKLMPEMESPDDVFDRQKILAHLSRPHCPGSHLCHMLLRSHDEYETLYRDEVHIYFREGLPLIRSRSDRLHVWNSHAYLARHPDVAGYESGPLAHYLMYGFPEGRSLH